MGKIAGKMGKNINFKHRDLNTHFTGKPTIQKLITAPHPYKAY
jgi:hypothetical protein